MKKLLSLFLVVVMALTFCACNKTLDNQSALSSTESDQSLLTDTPSIETIKPSSSDKTSQNDTTNPTNTPSNTSSVESIETNSDVSTDSKPQQTVTDDPNTITAPNGDKIYIKLQKGENPTVTVKVNGKEIYSYNNFKKHKDKYDFDKDFTDKIIAEYSDEEILWAYQFNWGVVYSTKYTTSTTKTETTISYACSKHEYEKCYFRNINHHKIAIEWNLIDFDVIEESGTKIFWNPYAATQAIFEYYYKTEDYTLKEIDDLEKAGYSFSDKRYYEMHNTEFNSGAGLNKYRKIYEVSVNGKPFALLYADSTCNYFMLQELDWSTAGSTACVSTENGIEYRLYKFKGDELTDLS